MTQKLKRGWRMMLGIVFLLFGALGLTGCERNFPGLLPAEPPEESEPIKTTEEMGLEREPLEYHQKSLEQSENSAAVRASEQVEPVVPRLGGMPAPPKPNQ